MTLGNVIYVFCFVFKSCFRITRWVGNKFQVFFSRKENCNEISFTCVKSRECISSWFSLKHVDSSDMTLNRKSCVRRSPAGATCSFSTGACWSWRRLQVGRTAKPIPEGMMLLITSTAEEAEGTGWPAWTHPSEGYRSKWTRSVSRNASHPQQALLGSLSVLWGSREVRSVHQKACICLYTLHTVFKFLWVLMSTSVASRF